MSFGQMRQNCGFLARNNSSYVHRMRHQQKNTVPAAKHVGDWIVLWGCFAAFNRGCLESVQGTAKSLDYQRDSGAKRAP